MTVESVNYNLERLRIFLGASKEHWPVLADNVVDARDLPKWLLDTYGRMLDYYGCAKTGVSRILLTYSDYWDFNKWAGSVPTLQIWGGAKNEYLGISYNTYNWDIIKVEKIQP